MTLVQKQRLIGAALLLFVIGVIAWLLLASVAKNDIDDIVDKPIPFDSIIEPLDDEPERVEPPVTAQQVTPTTQSDDTSVNKDNEKLTEKEHTAPAPAPAPAPEKAVEQKNQILWVLQLASFGVRDNADALSKELESMGYNPLIEIVKTDKNPIYRVRLQPVADRDKLEKTAKMLSEKLKLSTQILQYQP